jgi:opacity protein-like surface antigen
MRAVGSIGFIIGKYGIIGADYEMVDYTSARLRSYSYKYIDENKNIRSKYTVASNLRVGAEARIQPMSVRIGYALYGNPYKPAEKMDGTRTSYTAGIGFREDNFFVDFAYVYTQWNEDYYLYDPDVIAGPSKNSMLSSSVLMTLGFKF